MAGSDAVRDLIGGGVIVLNRPVVERFGFSVAAMLHELSYWCVKAEEAGDDWAYRTQQELRQATYLSDEAQLVARRKLADAGILVEERRGLPARLYFRIDWDTLTASWNNQNQPVDSGGKNPLTAGTGSRTERIHTLRKKKKEQVENPTHLSDSQNVIHLGDRSKAEKAAQADKAQQDRYRQWFGVVQENYPAHRREEKSQKPWQAFRALMAPGGVPLADQEAHQLAVQICEGLDDWNESDQWAADEGKYVPKLSNFLANHTWEEPAE